MDLPRGSVFFLFIGNTFCNKRLCNISVLRQILICSSDKRLSDEPFVIVAEADFSLLLPKAISPVVALGRNKSVLILLILGFNPLPSDILLYRKILYYIIFNMCAFYTLY